MPAFMIITDSRVKTGRYSLKRWFGGVGGTLRIKLITKDPKNYSGAIEPIELIAKPTTSEFYITEFELILWHASSFFIYFYLLSVQTSAKQLPNVLVPICKSNKQLTTLLRVLYNGKF